MTPSTLYGPFDELITLMGLPASGPISDQELSVIKEGGITVTNGKIVSIGKYRDLIEDDQKKVRFNGPVSVIPSFIDAHTHMCFAGSRLNDYQKKLQGQSYCEIAKAGGGILETVRATRNAAHEDLLDALLLRLETKLKSGVSTVEIKSGYGLDYDTEIKMLEVLIQANALQPLTIIPTLLAAHALPPEFSSNTEYLEWISSKLLPKVKNLTSRVDIFCDECAFNTEESTSFLEAAKKQGYMQVIHADQFSKAGSSLASNMGALSADHLEMSGPIEFELLKKSNTIPIVLPGASLGLGLPFAKARQMLDYGLPLVIASDWNPGSAPSGNLLMQASILAMYEKLSIAETLSAITFRAARALGLNDRGILKKGVRADFSIFNTKDFREILYYQGTLKPSHAVIEGLLYSFNEKVLK